MEMSKEQVVNRILSNESNIEIEKIRKQNMSDEEWKKLEKENEKLKSLKILIDDTPRITISNIEEKCRKKKEEDNIGLIIIDYLQMIQGKETTNNTERDITEIITLLKILAREINVPIVLLSQISRAVDMRDEHRPTLQDFRESDTIIQVADIILFLYREDYYNTEDKPTNKAEIIIAKNRNGKLGTVELKINFEFCRFIDK